MLVVVQSLPTPAEVEPSRTEVRLRFRMTYPGGLSHQPLDGRLLLFLSKDDRDEPRFQISDNSLQTQQVFGIDVEGWNPEQEAFLDGIAPGYPLESLAEVPPGTYTIQALLHKYETFHRSDGHRHCDQPNQRIQGWRRSQPVSFCGRGRHHLRLERKR